MSNQQRLVDEYMALSIEDKVLKLKDYNKLYREGAEVIDDNTYDFLLELLATQDPSNEYLDRVEPTEIKGNKIKLPIPMLSTCKVRTKAKVLTYYKSVVKACKKLGKEEEDLEFVVTPKLDGFSGLFYRGRLLSRGDGVYGEDNSVIFKKGVMPIGLLKDLSVGEIVVDSDYFENNLSKDFKNSRNFISSLRGTKNTKEVTLKAIGDQAIHFVPFNNLERMTIKKEALLEDIFEIKKTVEESVPYDTDGIVVEVTDEDIKKEMGYNNHHHKWQIAVKVDDSFELSTVVGVTPQIAGNGKLTPIIEIEPVVLNGATITKVSGHNYPLMKTRKIGVGSKVKVIRSGMVIPKIVEVLSEGDVYANSSLPDTCPWCGGKLTETKSDLLCKNRDCSERSLMKIIFFFKRLNVKGIGDATMERIYKGGFKTVVEFMKLNEEDLFNMEFRKKESANVLKTLEEAKSLIGSTAFLDGFGIDGLGYTNSKRYLLENDIKDLYKVSRLTWVDLFGEKMGDRILLALEDDKEHIESLMTLL